MPIFRTRFAIGGLTTPAFRLSGHPGRTWVFKKWPAEAGKVSGTNGTNLSVRFDFP